MTDKKDSRSRTTIHHRHFAPKGSIIIQQGEMGNTAFLIQSGQVIVYAENEGRRVELARLGPGQIVGEMALVTDGPRKASVEALEDCNLIVISRPVMNGKLAKTDPTIRAIVPMLMERLARANEAALNNSGSLDDLVAVANSIYHRVEGKLEAPQRKTLERTVKPGLDAFIQSVSEFRKTYGDV